jgi:hypothetical protein
MRRVRAEVLNFAGRWVYRVGSALYDIGLELCGWGGSLDAWADNAGYWDHHTTEET